MRRLFLATCGLLMMFPTSEVFSHAEHGKKRYVSSDGLDSGNCDNALRPCKSIAYAVQRAAKGDLVLVSSGQYKIENTEDIFYLTSDIVPITAGFNRFDHFQNQSPQLNKTFLTGVPREFVDSLTEKGFTIVNDGKSFKSDPALKAKLSQVSALKQAQADEPCVAGTAAGFACNNIDLVSHFPLTALSPTHSAASDIWGHVDLNTGNEYAIMGLRSGVTVIDLSDPENPSQVGQISGTSTTWRDIKVYQFFDRASFRWKAYAYVTADSANDGVVIIDLNDLPNAISLVERNRLSTSAHNVYISNLDHTLNIALEGVSPSLQLVGDRSNANGSFHSYSLSDASTISRESNAPATNGYTHDGASIVLRDSRVTTGCVNGNQTCTLFVDFNETEMSLWDISNPSDSELLSTRTYNDVSNSNKYVHSGWVTEDANYVFIHDEFDETRGGLNSTVRVFDISNLRSPVQVGQWTGSTRAIDHNGFVRGNRHYMSNYERGLTILNIEDPANPVEAGFFDTFPSSNNASFNGAWGAYPYLPSGLILVSDINSGLYVLRDKTQNQTQGSIRFAVDSISSDRGTTVNVEVLRENSLASASSVSVAYEMIPGSATSGEDYVLASGILNWNGNDSTAKTIPVELLPDPNNEQFTEEFFLRLYDPKSGATLTSPSYVKVIANGIVNAGAVEFSSTAQERIESAGVIDVTVNRVGGSTGAASVDYALVSGTAIAGSDFTAGSGTLSWADGESGAKVIQIAITNDTDNESDESFTVELSGATGASLGANTTITVTILDDDSNTAPEVTVDNDFEANQGQTVELVGSATDAQNDDLSYQWRQTAGSTMALSNSDEPTASFVASAVGSFTFELTVTDSRGGASAKSVTVTVIQATSPPPTSSSGGGSVGFILITGLVLLIRRKFN